ncbi:esterase/lipase [Actinobacteria bacterium IMCC26207]|nr:esterase/lipase [Actinobacteria bacterium IMCC26207]
MRRVPTDTAIDRHSRALLRQGLLRSALVINAYRPKRNSQAWTVPSFFASWLVTEAAPIFLALTAARTSRELGGALRDRAERSRESGDDSEKLLQPSGWFGLALTAAASLGVGGLIRQAQQSSEEFDAALSTLLSEDELLAAPQAVRLGAILPVLNGSSRRRRTRNIVFSEHIIPAGKTVRLKLNVYAPLEDPKPGQKRPAVLQIHGGAWVLGSKDEQGIPLLNHLASCGWVGFNADYQLSPKVKYPGHLVDCKQALVWIREHAEEYNVDPNFIVVTGGSAGGHLCALVALTQNDPAFQPGFETADTSVQAAVPFYGVYDLTDREGYNGRQFTDLLTKTVMGVTMKESPAAWAAYSPLDRITEEAPAMMVIHGDKDVLVPVEGARSFAEALRKTSKSPVVYAELHGAQHAFEIFSSFRTVNAVQAVERFLNHIYNDYLHSLEGGSADSAHTA